MRIPQRVGAAVLLAAAAAALPHRGEAHKPITSPFTFNEDVFPIVRERCAACHVPGGVAPMSLLTHADAVPWGESIKVELLSGHMPPWNVHGLPRKFRNVQPLTAREMNVLLTWASGGTPMGDPEKAPAAITVEHAWPLGAPDLVVELPREVTLTEAMQEHVEEFAIPLPATASRSLRAVDLLPGNPAIVRSATVSIRSRAETRGAVAPERVLAVWAPGDHAVPLDEGVSFQLPANAELTVSVRYRKTWQYERATVSDRSSVGLYFAASPGVELQAFVLEATSQPATVREPLRVLGVYPDPAFANGHATVTILRPNGSREELISLRARDGWARRYWFAEPVLLPVGTRIEVSFASPGDELLPPGAIEPTPADPSTARVILNVLSEH